MKRTRWTGGAAWAVGAILACVAPAPAEIRVAAPRSAAAPPGTQPASSKQVLPAQRGVEPDEPVPANAKATLVGWLELTGGLPDAPPPYAWIGGDEGKPSLRRVIREVRKVAQDPRFHGLVIHLDQAELDHTQVDELSQAIGEVRAAGKKVAVFAEQYDLKSYLLACAADEVWLQTRGQLELSGLGIEEIYLAGLFEKIGVKADFMQVGKFKGAEEPLTRKGPSPEWSQNIDGLLDDLWKQVVERIGKARRLQPAEVEKAFADSWAMTDRQYVERKLIDRLTARDMVDATEALYGDAFEWEDLLDNGEPVEPIENPFALLQMLLQPSKPAPRRASIALIHAYGPITSGDGQTAGSPEAGLFGGDSVGSRTFTEALSDAQDDDLIKGVVIRLDSPGGSALASEVIWQAVRGLAEKKPVYVSVGAVAASGGYYIACAGERVYVSPGSIVGSIGVVGGKIVLGDLYEKLGLAVTRRSRGPLGDMFNSVQPFTEPQRAALTEAFKHTYEQFLDRVAAGRGKKIADPAAVAQGRIFSGRQAVANGLADKLGGVDVALSDLAAALELKPGSYDVITLPPPLSLPEFLETILGGLAAAPGTGDGTASGALPGRAEAAALKALLGREGWRSVRGVLGGMMLMQREPVLTLMPAAVIVR